MNIFSRQKWMLWPLCLVFAVPCAAQTSSIEPAPVAPADALQDAHFSLLLRDVPLRRMLKLLEDTTGLQFRYAALPDARVTTSFNNAPLLPTLEDVLQDQGFTMLREDRSAWLLRTETITVAAPLFAPARTRGASAAISGQGPLNVWSVWSRPEAPQQWTTLESPSAPRIMPMAPGAPGPIALIQGWRRAVLQLETAALPATDVQAKGAQVPAPAQHSPGVAILATPSSDGKIYLRYPLQVRDGADGFGAARLLLETPFDATLYVNGAPLLRAWKGRRVIDLSRVLNPGLNTLALACEVGSPAAPPAASPAASPVEATPTTAPMHGPKPIIVLRYEWLFDAPHDAQQPAEERIG